MKVEEKSMEKKVEEKAPEKKPEEKPVEKKKPQPKNVNTEMKKETAPITKPKNPSLAIPNESNITFLLLYYCYWICFATNRYHHIMLNGSNWFSREQSDSKVLHQHSYIFQQCNKKNQRDNCILCWTISTREIEERRSEYIRIEHSID